MQDQEELHHGGTYFNPGLDQFDEAPPGLYSNDIEQQMMQIEEENNARHLREMMDDENTGGGGGLQDVRGIMVEKASPTINSESQGVSFVGEGPLLNVNYENHKGAPGNGGAEHGTSSSSSDSSDSEGNAYSEIQKDLNNQAKIRSKSEQARGDLQKTEQIRLKMKEQAKKKQYEDMLERGRRAPVKLPPGSHNYSMDQLMQEMNYDDMEDDDDDEDYDEDEEASPFADKSPTEIQQLMKQFSRQKIESSPRERPVIGQEYRSSSSSSSSEDEENDELSIPKPKPILLKPGNKAPPASSEDSSEEEDDHSSESSGSSEGDDSGSKKQKQLQKEKRRQENFHKMEMIKKQQTLAAINRAQQQKQYTRKMKFGGMDDDEDDDEEMEDDSPQRGEGELDQDDDYVRDLQGNARVSKHGQQMGFEDEEEEDDDDEEIDLEQQERKLQMTRNLHQAQLLRQSLQLNQQAQEQASQQQLYLRQGLPGVNPAQIQQMLYQRKLGNSGPFGAAVKQDQQFKNIFPDPLKRDDIEAVYLTLKDISSQQMMGRYYEKKIIAMNSLKTRNFVYLEWLGQFFEYYEEKLKGEQDGVPDSVDQQDSASLSQVRLTQLAQIYRLCVILEDQGFDILNALLTDRFYLQFFGALEYLPDYIQINIQPQFVLNSEENKCTQGSTKFRDFLLNSKFKKIFEFDERLNKKIATLFRVSYLKETVLSREDQSNLKSINSLTNKFQLEIIESVLNHATISKLFQVKQSEEEKEPSLQEWNDIVQLLYDLITRCKAMSGSTQLGGMIFSNHFQKVNPSEIMIKRKDHNILHFVKKILMKGDKIRNRAKKTGLDKIEIHSSYMAKVKGGPAKIKKVIEQVADSELLFQKDSTFQEDQQKNGQDQENFEKQIQQGNTQVEPIAQKCVNQVPLQEVSNNESVLEKERPDETIEEEIEHQHNDSLVDQTISTLLDILHYLLQISTKDMLHKFILDRELSMQLSLQFFLTDNEGIRLQILEFYRQILDNTMSDPQQRQVEDIFCCTLLEVFIQIVESQKISEFSEQIQFVFEFIQYICKPQINMPQPQPGGAMFTEPPKRERKSNTEILKKFILKSDLLQVALNIISQRGDDSQKINTQTKLMAAKFLKGLIQSDQNQQRSSFSLIHQHTQGVFNQDASLFPLVIQNADEVYRALLRVIDTVKNRYDYEANLIQSQTSEKIDEQGLQNRVLKRLHVNMFESVVFEVLNMYPMRIYNYFGEPEFRVVIDDYKHYFEWCKSMLKPYFTPENHSPSGIPLHHRTVPSVAQPISAQFQAQQVYSSSLGVQTRSSTQKLTSSLIMKPPPSQKPTPIKLPEISFQDLILRDYTSEMLENLKLGKRQMRDWEEPDQSDDVATSIEQEYQKVQREFAQNQRISLPSGNTNEQDENEEDEIIDTNALLQERKRLCKGKDSQQQVTFQFKSTLNKEVKRAPQFKSASQFYVENGQAKKLSMPEVFQWDDDENELQEQNPSQQHREIINYFKGISPEKDSNSSKESQQKVIIQYPVDIEMDYVSEQILNNQEALATDQPTVQQIAQL